MDVPVRTPESGSDAESKVKSLFYFLPVKTEFQKMQTCLVNSKNSNTRSRSKSTEELKKVVIQTKSLNPKKVIIKTK